jgi:hypothetical protein
VVVSVVAAALVAVGLAACRVRSAAPEEPVRPAAAGVDEVFTELPARLRPPAEAPELPTDRGVGRAALVYQLTDPDSFERDIYLVTRTGEHVRLGDTPSRPGPADLSLSPDGRWLAAKRDDRWSVRDLTGTAELGVPVVYDLWLWSTDARSVLLGIPGPDGRAFAVMDLPDGTVRHLDVRTSNTDTEVAFVAGRELAVFESNPLDPSAAQEVTLLLTDVGSGATRRLPVLAPGQLGPGEVVGPLVAPWHAGGNPPSIWVGVGGRGPVPTGAREGTPMTPTTALVGVDVASGAAAGRIEMPPGGTHQSRGVVGDGIVLQHWTATATELIVVDPRRGTRRVVTMFPEAVIVLVPGATA